MKRFFITILFLLSFPLFAEPLTIYGSNLDDNMSTIIKKIENNDWIFEPFSDSKDNPNANLTFSKYDIQKKKIETLDLSFENSKLKYITYSQDNIIHISEWQSNVYLFEKYSEQLFNKFYNKYNCKELNDEDFITENNIVFSYYSGRSILSVTEFSYNITVSLCIN